MTRARGSRRFSPLAIATLRSAVWDPQATRMTDLLAGGFVWSDENLHEAARTGIREDLTAERMLVAYRASISMGMPRAALSEPWEQVCEEVPDWPGLRPERRSESIGAELEDDLVTEHEGFIRLRAELEQDGPGLAG